VLGPLLRRLGKVVALGKVAGKPGDLDTLLDLVRRRCSGLDIQDILRKAKELNKAVRVSGEDKEAKIENLRDALNLKALSHDNVYERFAKPRNQVTN